MSNYADHVVGIASVAWSKLKFLDECHFVVKGNHFMLVISNIIQFLIFKRGAPTTLLG